MRNEIIELIKTYRAESQKLWDPVTGYQDEFARKESAIYNRFANELEKLLLVLNNKDHLRIPITEKRDFDTRENDITNILGPAYFKQRDIERIQAQLKEKIRKKIVPATHTGRMAERGE